MNFLPPNLLFKQKYFGLALNRNSLKAITLNVDKTTKSYAQVPLSPNIFDHGVIQPQPLIEALQKIISQGNFSTKFVAVTIPDIYSFSRIHTLPKIPLEEVSEAIQWQLEKIFPLPQDEIYYDWKLINSSDTELTISIVSLRKKLLDDLVNVFEVADIKPLSFEPAASALARVIDTKSLQPYVLIDLNQATTSATLIENQLSTLTVTHTFDAQDLNLAMQKINQSITELTNYYNSKHQTSPTKFPVYITGESVTNELVNWFNQNLQTKISVLNIPNITPAFHQAYAAAATTILPPQSEKSINLLPSKLQHLFDASLERKQITSTIQISFSLLFISLAITSGVFLYSLIQIKKANHTITQLENSAGNYSYDTKQLATLNKSSSAVVKLFPLKTTPVNFINEVLRLTPHSISIHSFTYSKEKSTLTFVGNANSRYDLLQFRDQLQQLPHFTDIQTPLESLEKPFDVDFSITAVISKQKQ